MAFVRACYGGARGVHVCAHFFLWGNRVFLLLNQVANPPYKVMEQHSDLNLFLDQQGVDQQGGAPRLHYFSRKKPQNIRFDT